MGTFMTPKEEKRNRNKFAVNERVRMLYVLLLTKSTSKISPLN